MADRIATFRDFWPYYLAQHTRPLTRLLHYLGTGGLFVVMAVAIATHRLLVLALLPAVGYGFAWAAHLLVEKNRPATFTYPLWSLRADFVMLAKMLTGKLGTDVARATSLATGVRRTPSP